MVESMSKILIETFVRKVRSVYELDDTDEIRTHLDIRNVHLKDPSLKAKSKLYTVTEDCTTIFPFCRFNHLHVNLKSSHDYRLQCAVFNIEWDMLQADEIVLESVRELKARLM